MFWKIDDHFLMCIICQQAQWGVRALWGKAVKWRPSWTQAVSQWPGRQNYFVNICLSKSGLSGVRG